MQRIRRDIRRIWRWKLATPGGAAKVIKQVNNVNDAYEQIMARRRKEAEAAAKKAIEEFTETKPQKTAVH